MIGRGLISDPFLPQMIKADTTVYPEDRMEVFGKFHDTLFHEFEQSLSGPKHIILKMFHYWEYFANAFEDSSRGLKKIKKAKTIEAYHDAVSSIIRF